MQSAEFIRRVRTRVGLPDNEHAKRATEAVLEALRARISHEGGRNVAAQLPKELREMWESGVWEHVARSLTGFEGLDLGEFLTRVADLAGLADVDQAETVTRAVFVTLREQITAGAQHTLEAQFPDDIREFWRECVPPKQEPEIQEMPYEFEAPVPTTTDELPAAAGPGAGPETGVQAPSKSPVDTHAPPPYGRYGPEQVGPAAASVSRSDAQIRDEIEDLLESNDQVEAEKIDVYVQAGQVTLIGTVNEPTARATAERIAREALGATAVRNEIRVTAED